MKSNDSLDKNDEHDLAIQIACERFEQLYPIETQPTWLKYCMSINVTKNRNQNWVVKMKLRPKYELKTNRYLAWHDDGTPIIVEADPATGKKKIVICGGPPVDHVIFFEVEIDVVNHLPTVHVNCDLNSLDGKQYEINMW